MSEVSNCRNQKIGIMWVNSYGIKHNTLAFYQNIRKQNKKTIIIEDNCLCIPETERTVPTEEVDLELYSTGYSKYVQMSKEGGFGLLRDNLKYNDVCFSYNINGYKQQQDKVVECLKTNSTFTYEENDWLPTDPLVSDKYPIEQYLQDIRCLTSKSKKHKDKINAIYNANIPNILKLGGDLWRYNILLPSEYNRDLLLDKIFTKGLYASNHYMSVARIFKQQICINAEREACQIINLFNEEKYSEDMAFETAKIINDYLIELSIVDESQ